MLGLARFKVEIGQVAVEWPVDGRHLRDVQDVPLDAHDPGAVVGLESESAVVRRIVAVFVLLVEAR